MNLTFLELPGQRAPVAFAPSHHCMAVNRQSPARTVAVPCKHSSSVRLGNMQAMPGSLPLTSRHTRVTRSSDRSGLKARSCFRHLSAVSSKCLLNGSVPSQSDGSLAFLLDIFFFSRSMLEVFCWRGEENRTNPSPPRMLDNNPWLFLSPPHLIPISHLAFRR